MDFLFKIPKSDKTGEIEVKIDSSHVAGVMESIALSIIRSVTQELIEYNQSREFFVTYQKPLNITRVIKDVIARVATQDTIDEFLKEKAHQLFYPPRMEEFLADKEKDFFGLTASYLEQQDNFKDVLSRIFSILKDPKKNIVEDKELKELNIKLKELALIRGIVLDEVESQKLTQSFVEEFGFDAFKSAANEEESRISGLYLQEERLKVSSLEVSLEEVKAKAQEEAQKEAQKEVLQRRKMEEGMLKKLEEERHRMNIEMERRLLEQRLAMEEEMRRAIEEERKKQSHLHLAHVDITLGQDSPILQDKETSGVFSDVPSGAVSAVVKAEALDGSTRDGEGGVARGGERRGGERKRQNTALD